MRCEPPRGLGRGDTSAQLCGISGRGTARTGPAGRPSAPNVGGGAKWGALESLAMTTADDVPMTWTLEVVVVPVSDLDRATAFYSEQLGFHLDHDVVIDEHTRLVQLTPPGSGCSVVMGSGAVVPAMPPGSLKGLQLVVPDLARAHRELTARGVDVSPIQSLGANAKPTAHPLDNVGFVFFSDPDGNGWAVQQISSRAASAQAAVRP